MNTATERLGICEQNSVTSRRPQPQVKTDLRRSERVNVFTGAYDKLDYCLMATFPASDATAQY